MADRQAEDAAFEALRKLAALPNPDEESVAAVLRAAESEAPKRELIRVLEFSQEPIRYSQMDHIEKEFFMQKPRVYERPRHFWKRDYKYRDNYPREKASH